MLVKNRMKIEREATKKTNARASYGSQRAFSLDIRLPHPAEGAVFLNQTSLYLQHAVSLIQSCSRVVPTLFFNIPSLIFDTCVTFINHFSYNSSARCIHRCALFIFFPSTLLSKLRFVDKRRRDVRNWSEEHVLNDRGRRIRGIAIFLSVVTLTDQSLKETCQG